MFNVRFIFIIRTLTCSMCDSQATRRLMFTGMTMISLFPVVT